MGVKILKVNPPYIKVHNQYVECCCAEDKQVKLLRRLRKLNGVTDVAIIADPESLGRVLCKINFDQYGYNIYPLNNYY